MSEKVHAGAYFAPQSTMLFAQFLDQYEISKLTESVTDLSSELLGGRTSSLIRPELSLLSRSLYYACSILGLGVTPGQALCDFKIVQTYGTNKVSKAHTRSLLKAIALYSLLPYIYDRKSDIFSGLVNIYEFVVTPEDIPSAVYSEPEVNDGGVESMVQGDYISDDSDEILSEPSESSELINITERSPPIDSFITKFIRALISAVSTIASSSSERLDTMLSFLMDFHRMFFFRFGRFGVLFYCWLSAVVICYEIICVPRFVQFS